MRIGGCLDEVDADADCVASFLNATFKNVRYAKLLRDLREIARRTLEALCGSTRDHLQIADFRQSHQNLLLNALGKICVIGIAAKILKRQDGDALLVAEFLET